MGFDDVAVDTQVGTGGGVNLGQVGLLASLKKGSIMHIVEFPLRMLEG